jgi:leucyl aminopeptidase (aminopeptidase T)
MVDEPLTRVRDALLAEAQAVGPAELWAYTFPDALRPFSAFPDRLIEIAAGSDVAILLLARLDPDSELRAHVAARTAIAGGKARYAAGAYIDDSILAHELSADYELIATRSHALAERLEGSSEVHLTSALGTDLRFSIRGRSWRVDSGILRGRGVYGNLPAGEIFIAPIEESADGMLIIDKSLPGLVLTEPVRVKFDGGRAVRIEGGAGAEFLERAIADEEDKPGGEWARSMAELGIGTNPAARLQGNIITDEKVAGTVHIAIGRNDFLGGVSLAPIHIDGVIGEPTLRIDGEIVIAEGRLRED